MKLYYTAFSEFSGHDAAYALLRYAFSAIYGCDMPDIEKSPGGKPFFPSIPNVHFSLSHTKGYALCAIGDKPMGADMEKVRETRPNLSSRVRSKAEEECFDFFSSWVLKESFIKLCGTMEMPLREMCFTGSAEDIVCPRDGLYARLYDTVEGYRAAVCSMSPGLPAAAEFVPFNAIFY